MACDVIENVSFWLLPPPARSSFHAMWITGPSAAIDVKSTSVVPAGTAWLSRVSGTVICSVPFVSKPHCTKKMSSFVTDGVSASNTMLT